MKKGRVFAAVGVLLVLVLAASLLAGCDLGKKKVKDEAATHSLSELKISEKAPELKLVEISELRGYDSMGSPDALGLIIASKTEYDEDSGAATTDWILYDLVLDNVVRKTTGNRIKERTDGLYYITETDTSGDDPVDKTTFFGRGGFSETVEGEPVYDDDCDDIVILPDGRRLYVDMNGTLAYEENPIKNILSRESLNYYSYRTGSIYYDFDDEGMLDIADAETGTIKRVCLNTLFGVSENASAHDGSQWRVGEKIFVQYTTKLPEDAQVYDFYDTGKYDEDNRGKYDVDTFVYDLKTGEAAAVKDFNFVVDGDQSFDDFAILRGNYFENGSLRAGVIAQSFDKNGKVFVDLQKVLPGMTGCLPGEDGWILCTDMANNLYFYHEGKLVSEINYDIGLGSADLKLPFIVTPNALYGIDLEKIADFEEGEKEYDICGDTVITRKIVDSEEQYFATNYKMTVDQDGKIVVNKSEKHEKVLPGEYTYYLTEADAGAFDLYEGSVVDPIGRIEADDVGSLDMRKVYLDGDDELILVKGLYREVVPAGTSGEDGSPTPAEYIFVYYVIKAA